MAPWNKYIGCLLLVTFIIIRSTDGVACITNPSTTENYPHSNVMSIDKYLLYWRHDTTKIVFEIHTAGTGWVGLGLSPDGSMPSSDILMAFVSGSNGTIQDSYASGRSTPTADSNEDWTLLNSAETGGCTMVKVERNIIVYDSDDRNITIGNMNILWAYGSSDVLSSYHSANRQSVALQILYESTTTQASTILYESTTTQASTTTVNSGTANTMTDNTMTDSTMTDNTTTDNTTTDNTTTDNTISTTNNSINKNTENDASTLSALTMLSLICQALVITIYSI